MELFKSGIKTVLGGQSTNAPPTSDLVQGAETIERLVERLRSATLLDDRRDASRALRSLSKKYRVEVGAQGMDTILHTLATDKLDVEMTIYSIETLLNITSPILLEEEEGEQMKEVGTQFTEILIKKGENVHLLLSALEEYDFRIRLPLIKLLTNLLSNKPREMQEILLVSPMGVSKLLDLLSDRREVVRNDALLLLTALTKNNSSIQKIIAFENGFDKILQIIHEEGYSDGGPIVEDCLLLLINLLKGNTSNQTFFREGSYVKRLLSFFSLPLDPEEGWGMQKVSNFYYMLQIVRTLVSPLNPTHVASACQKSLKNFGILEILCSILMANGVPVETLTEAIFTVGDSIRGSRENQNYFASVIAPSDPPRPALVLILMTLVNERQSIYLRCAVLYCVQCFLYKNEKSQEDMIRTLLPGSSSEVGGGSISSGQLLCSGLFSRDMTVNWFSSIALSHALLDNVSQKENLLRVQLVAKTGTPPVTLLNHILASLLTQEIKTEVKLGFLQLISIWLESCPNAIAQFLSNTNSVPYLITQITSADSDDKEVIVHGLSAFIMGLCLYFNPNTVPAYTKESLHKLITNRIGMETLSEGLNQISKSEPYLHSLKHPQLSAKHFKDLVFDHNYCLLFKKYESLILLTLSSESSGQKNLNASSESPNEILGRYKEVIRSQDEALAKAREENEMLSKTNSDYKIRQDELMGEVAQLRNQLTLALVQNETVQRVARHISEDEHTVIVNEKERKIESLELQLLKLEQSYHGLSLASPPIKNQAQEDLISKLEEELITLNDELSHVKGEQTELLELLAEQDNRISDYKTQLRALGVHIPSDEDEEEDVEEVIEKELVHKTESIKVKNTNECLQEEFFNTQPPHHQLIPQQPQSNPQSEYSQSNPFAQAQGDNYFNFFNNTPLTTPTSTNNIVAEQSIPMYHISSTTNPISLIPPHPPPHSTYVNYEGTQNSAPLYSMSNGVPFQPTIPLNSNDNVVEEMDNRSSSGSRSVNNASSAFSFSANSTGGTTNNEFTAFLT